eukprot:TRINITY_DN4613_c0_g1_i1.p1 TRINITY_DN4613_c0_g1~~TRINITY_DN4613_c0_g1_i1.p1  ORF type:complete len:165 (-),score=49.91 TRINITY_DN4613_c0_g1_i1:108-602(-)
MFSTAVKKETKILIDNKAKFMLAHSNTGHKHSLKEVLMDKNVAMRLEDTKASSEVLALHEFLKALKSDPDRAVYGPKHVQVANENLAIKKLLISDNLFRSADLQTRKKYVSMVEQTKDNGGQVLIFSSAHVTGEQLSQYSGVAATLRFPLTISDSDTEEEDEQE